MTETTLRATPLRRRTVGGGTLGLALAVATVGTGATGAQAQEYTVRPGDTVSHIALRTATSVAAISSANHLDQRHTIRVGQRLQIPSSAPAPVVPTQRQAPTATHTVVAGDTVSALAARHGTTVDAIVQANGLDARALIRIGQTLSVPSASAPTPAAPAAAPAATTGHRVVSGDTVSALALRYGTTVDAIVRANGLDARALIRVGQTLTVTSGSATAAPAPAPSAAPATVSHRVVAGDTVSALALRHGTTVDAIVQANGLNSRALVRIGQTLSVPTSTAATSTTSTNSVNPAPSTQLVGNTFAGRTYPDTTVAAANANKATLLAHGVPSRDDMRALVAATARQMGVDPALALAISYQESGFNQAAVSPANAIGAMQVIPTSGDWASDLVGRELNLLDPNDNVVAGVAILRQLLRTAPDLPTAIAGYYQGLAGVRKHGMFPDTRRYVASVQTLMTRFS